MTAVPRTAATRTSAGRSTQEPLHGSHPAHAWPHPLDEVAAHLSFSQALPSLSSGPEAAVRTSQKRKFMWREGQQDGKIAGRKGAEARQVASLT